MVKHLVVFWALSALACVIIQNVQAEVNRPMLTIAVASNFQYPLSKLLENSPKWRDYPIRIVTGSSGTLYSQISNGAPFDVFLSADSERPLRLEQNGLSIIRVPYAQGKLAIWPITMANTTSIELMQQANKVAIANPALAPFGSAALAYIKGNDSSKSIMQKLVYGANVTQAFQFVDSGNAQVGIVAESLLLQASFLLEDASYLAYRLLNEAEYPDIIQEAVVLKRSQHKEEASSFIAFLTSPASQQALTGLGYLSILTSNNDVYTEENGDVVKLRVSQ